MGIGIFYSGVFYLSAYHFECWLEDCHHQQHRIRIVWIIGSILSKVGNDGSHGTQGVSAKAVLMTWTGAGTAIPSSIMHVGRSVPGQYQLMQESPNRRSMYNILSLLSDRDSNLTLPLICASNGAHTSTEIPCCTLTFLCRDSEMHRKLRVCQQDER